MRPTRPAVTLAAVSLAAAALAACNNSDVTNPPNKASTAEAMGGANGEGSAAGGAGGTRDGTNPQGAGPRELATANTEHAPNQESEQQR